MYFFFLFILNTYILYILNLSRRKLTLNFPYPTRDLKFTHIPPILLIISEITTTQATHSDIRLAKLLERCDNLLKNTA